MGTTYLGRLLPPQRGGESPPFKRHFLIAEASLRSPGTTELNRSGKSGVSVAWRPQLCGLDLGFWLDGQPVPGHEFIPA